MAQREEAKNQNREKIKKAAARIIRKEGIEHLTMRNLANDAGVSLRTPYNLFGSKTDVLVALLDEASVGIYDAISVRDTGLVLEGLFSGINSLEVFFSKDEDFYRDVYWGIMSSDQPEARISGYQGVIDIVQSAMADACANKELDPQTNTIAFGNHIAIELMAILGMWGSGYFDSHECANHIRASWHAGFLTKATRKSRQFLLRMGESIKMV